MVPEIVRAARKSVLAVGKARGFVFNTQLDTEPRVIVTAAHCLPQLRLPDPRLNVQDVTRPTTRDPAPITHPSSRSRWTRPASSIPF